MGRGCRRRSSPCPAASAAACTPRRTSHSTSRARTTGTLTLTLDTHGSRTSSERKSLDSSLAGEQGVIRNHSISPWISLITWESSMFSNANKIGKMVSLLNFLFFSLVGIFIFIPLFSFVSFLNEYLGKNRTHYTGIFLATFERSFCQGMQQRFCHFHPSHIAFVDCVKF